MPTLVSSLYRWIPPEGFNRDEADRRLKVKLRRLITEFGEEAVVNKIRNANVSKDMELMKAWLVLTTYASAVTARRAPPSA